MAIPSNSSLSALIIGLIVLSACKKEEEPVPYFEVEQEEEEEVIDPETFYETFDDLNTNLRDIQLFTFPQNGANFVSENVAIHQSRLHLTTSVNTNAALPKSYNGGEIGDKRFRTYGYYEVRMKPEIPSGTVGSFFLMNQWVAVAWEHQEIDIEFTGNKPTSMQMTTHHFANGGTNHLTSTTIKDLGFAYADDFHNYGLLWTADSISWFVDGQWFHTETQYVPHVPLQIRMNHWPGNMNSPGMQSWLGPVADYQLPSTVQYDWIKVMTLDEYETKRPNG